MDQEEWAKALKVLVNKGGGTLHNGWTVQVKSRPKGGGRDVKILDPEGGRFRSVSQASAALTGSGDTAAGKFRAKKRQKAKGNDLQKGAKGRGRPKTKGAGEDHNKLADASNGVGNVRKRKRKKQSGMEVPDEQPMPINGKAQEHPVFAKLLRQARLHVSRIRREMDILEVYDAEGWRGSNKDKLKPRAEMQRAQYQMGVSCGAVRGIVRQCEAGEGRAIPTEDYDSDGGLDQLKMFCAICGNNESTDENDIVLCDGPCRRAFHERCCTPNFSSADLDEDADWLCPACFTKDEVLDLLNEEFETSYELEVPADQLLIEDTFERHEAAPAGVGQTGGTWASLLGGTDLVSSDTDDDSYRGSMQGGDTPQDKDCEGAPLSRSPSRPSDSASDANSDSSEEDAVEGKRQRLKVDYVAMNSQMFGEEEEDVSDQDYR